MRSSAAWHVGPAAAGGTQSGLAARIPVSWLANQQHRDGGGRDAQRDEDELPALLAVSQPCPGECAAHAATADVRAEAR